MCKDINHGGQRCASETRKGLDSAVAAVWGAETAMERATASGSAKELRAAEQAMDEAKEALRQARIEHASTPTGAAEFQAIADNPAYGEAQCAAYRDILAKGTALREKNKAVGEAVAAAEAKKAAKAPKPTTPTPTRPDGKMVDVSALTGPEGGCFVDPESGDVVEIYKTYPWGDGGWQFETSHGWSVCVEKGTLIEQVPDNTEPTGETWGEYKADYSNSHHPNAITEDEFEEKYQPVWNDDEAMTDDPPAGVDTNHVWTIVEGELDYQYAIPGIHVVNRVGYIQTKKPWETGDEEAIWVDGSQYDD